MRAPLLRLGCLLSLLISSKASAITMDWTLVGNPGNACDSQSQGCIGAVGYEYWIGAYEVTNAQYAEFLNATAASDPFALYDEAMGVGHGGITRSGSPGAYTYSTIVGRGGMPVNYVSFFDALRFANWMNNGQGSGDTETGAYTLTGNNLPVPQRNAGAAIVLPTEDEWYKAAYLNPATFEYFDYPTGSNTQTTCGPPQAGSNHANCNNDVGDVTSIGSYFESKSPYGTFDQGGNVAEWNEGIRKGHRPIAGGSFQTAPDDLAASSDSPLANILSQEPTIGFRLVMLPEPSTALLVITGLLGLAVRRRGRA